jgi:hypothetical protein
MSLQPLVTELRTFVALQVGLLETLRSTLNGSEATLDMATVPRRGTVVFDNVTWSFFRHGSGIEFSGAGKRPRVDVYDRVDDPTCIDVWRLGTYFRSLGNRGIRLLRLVSSTARSSVEESVLSLLLELTARGAARRDGDRFYLTDEV